MVEDDENVTTTQSPTRVPPPTAANKQTSKTKQKTYKAVDFLGIKEK